MNFKIVTGLFLFQLLFIACGESISSGKHEIEVSENQKTRRFKVEKNMVELNLSNGEQTIELGQKMYYSASIHGSVGQDAKVWAEHDSIVKLVDIHFAYRDALVEGETGGDAAIKTYVFEGIKVGTSILTAQKIFREDVEEEHQIKIVVVEKK